MLRSDKDDTSSRSTSRRGTPAERPCSMTTLHIRNMVCNRCIRVVREELERLGLDVRSITLGEALLGAGADNSQLASIRTMLLENGFELIEDARLATIERIKHIVVDFVRESHEQHAPGRKTSEHIGRMIGKDYGVVSALFSSLEGVTLEQYVILQRVEYAKELLKYGERTLSEIAYQMGYSSVQHLSAQFKKVTGLTPSVFRSLVDNPRTSLDQVGR